MDLSEVVCDICGISIPIEAFPAHCVLCQNVSSRTASLLSPYNFWVNALFDTDLSDSEDIMLNHKIVRRLKDVDRAAPRKESSSEVCCVCMETMSNNVRRTTCGHEFCSVCIETWFDQNTTCPICKHDFGDAAGYDLIDTQTMQPVTTIEEPSASNPVVRSIMQRLEIIGTIMEEINSSEDM